MKRNFYYKTQTGFDEAVEVYLGQSSGKQLNEDILNSNNEILIVSPYIDESKLDDLIMLKKRNVNVRIAFSTLRKDQEKNILQKLVHQNKDTDLVLKEKKEKYKHMYYLSSIVCICMGVTLLIISLTSLRFDIKNIFLILISFLSFYGFRYFNIKMNNMRKIPIHKYSYSEKLNFKFLRNSKETKMFIHSKIYIIDRKIAYLGSLNFTNNGFTSNFETRIRITQKQKVEELVEFVHSIFDDNKNFNCHEILFLGRKAYTEEAY